MRFLLIILMITLPVLAVSQTHTNRGGSGPTDGDGDTPCPQLAHNAGQLELSYLKVHNIKSKDGKNIVDGQFEELIRKQSLNIDLKLVEKFKFPECKSCLSVKKQILVDLVSLYERNERCTVFDKRHELIPLMKNIIIHGN